MNKNGMPDEVTARGRADPPPAASQDVGLGPPGLRFPERLTLIHAPTPVVPLMRTGEQWGIDLRVKRDDLTGLAGSGNKLRKLEYIAAEAVAEGADVLITCGGVNSNHARATAFVAARLGIRSHLVLRGEDRRPPAGNLLLDKFLGAGLTFIGARQWPDRNDIMAQQAEAFSAEGRCPYIIPEGGSNAIGTLGYAAVIPELIQQVEAQGGNLRRIVHATGSGGTTAGLALGLAAVDRSDIDVFGVAVCNDAAYFDERIEAILDESVDRGWTPPEVRRRARWSIVEGYKGRGYGRTTAKDMAFYAALARREGIFVDPVYTGKAFVGLRGMVEAGHCATGTTIFLHTGGIFELFAFGPEIQALAPPD